MLLTDYAETVMVLSLTVVLLTTRVSYTLFKNFGQIKLLSSRLFYYFRVYSGRYCMHRCVVLLFTTCIWVVSFVILFAYFLWLEIHYYLLRGLSKAKVAPAFRSRFKDALLAANAREFDEALVAADSPIAG